MNFSVKRRRVDRIPLACAIVCLSATCLLAAPPKVTRLSIRGFQIGDTTRLAISGSGLADSPKILLDMPIAEQKLIEAKPKGDACEISVRLDESVTPGLYPLRIQTPGGVSAPEIVAIDALPQRLATTATDEPRSLPVVIHGAVAGAAVQESPFEGKQGQTITLDVLARRFGSKLRPVVHLYDSARRQVAWSLPLSSLSGDARLTATLPADGTYVVAIHDLTYAAAAPNYYRLAIGTFDYADAVFPPVVAQGASTPLELIGRFGDAPLAKLDATAAASALSESPVGEDRPLPWPGGFAPTGLRPHMQTSDLPELVEGGTLDASRKLPEAPVAVSGRLLQPGEIDTYLLDLAANEKIRVDVFADRLGSPVDATLELRDVKGARLVQNDDAVGPDPRLEYTAPKTPTTVTIAVSDALRRGDLASIYRVVVTKLVDEAASKPDFRLSFTEDTHNVAIDGRKVIRVWADRARYDGTIRLQVDGLPRGFSATPVEIPPGADGALVEIHRSPKSASDAWGSIKIRGAATTLKPALVRTAEAPTHPLGRLQPWLRQEGVVAATDVAQKFTVAWSDASAKGSTLYVGIDEKLAVHVLRDPAEKGIVRLSLITSQAPPPDGLQAAQAQALQLRGVTATVDAKPGKETVEFALRVPVELRLAEYDVALKAELLSADGKTTLAESYTPPRRFRAEPPVALVVTAPASPITLDAKTGAAIAVTGTLERRGGYAGDVTVTLVGLPKGVTAPSVVLKPKTEQYKLDIKLPPTFAAERLEGVKVAATIASDVRRSTATVKVETDLPPLDVQKGDAVTAAKKPAVKKPAAKSVPPKKLAS